MWAICTIICDCFSVLPCHAFSIQIFILLFMYWINAVLFIVPQDSITRVWTVQRNGRYILRDEPTEIHLETLPFRVSYPGLKYKTCDNYRHIFENTQFEIHNSTHESKHTILETQIGAQISWHRPFVLYSFVIIRPPFATNITVFRGLSVQHLVIYTNDVNKVYWTACNSEVYFV